MATDLQIREQLATMRSLPPQLEKLEGSLGTVQWPGERERLNFPSGMGLSEPMRKAAQDRMTTLVSLTTGGNLQPAECSKARLSLLTKLLLGYPAVGSGTDKAAQARLGFYIEAVADIAPWALDAAIKRWVHGDVENVNVDFAPSPGGLRRLCEAELSPFLEQIAKLQRLLSAVSIERAMNPAPIEVPASNVPRLKVVT